MSSVSQAKVFYFTGRYLQLSVYSMSGNMLRTAQFYQIIDPQLFVKKPGADKSAPG